MLARYRLLASLLVLLLAAAPLGAQPVQERYSEVRLTIPADGHLTERLAARGLVLDHARVEETARGRVLRTVLSATELVQARAAGVEVEVLVDDLAAEVAARPVLDAAEERAALAAGGIQGNIFGSMGGFPTYDEALAILDDMHAQYPNLITQRVSLGPSIEGRGMWMVEVSDHPGVDEHEPEVFMTALHHAREPAALTTVLYTLWYLLEHYDDDPQVRFLVNRRRLFVVPILNPDGYVYNQTTNPGGGGFWRKNRRVNGDGSRGVDLNRNYGYLWGYDNWGSSGNPSSETYRGAAAFSEPETRAVRDFLNEHRVRTAFNYHTFGDLLLYPWDYDFVHTPDDNLFVAAAQQMTAINHYTYGISPEILYPVNGGSDDWAYGEQTTKPKIFSFTPEVGDDFWPPSSQIVPLAVENLRANLLLLYYAGKRPPTGFDADFEALADAGVTDEGFALAAYPNPLTDAATLAFTLPEAGAARLAVYDVLGREVAVLLDGSAGAGRHEAVLDASGLAAGVYVARLTAGGLTATRQVVVTR